jgi:hypothetical protein
MSLILLVKMVSLIRTRCLAVSEVTAQDCEGKCSLHLTSTIASYLPTSLKPPEIDLISEEPRCSVSNSNHGYLYTTLQKRIGQNLKLLIIVCLLILNSIFQY